MFGVEKYLSIPPFSLKLSFMRLSFFLFGLILGCLLLVFFLKKKGTTLNYFPNERVLSQLRKKKICYAPSIQNTEDTITCQKLLQDGTVIFSESIIRSEECNEYKIISPDQDQTFIRVDFCDSTAFIKELSKSPMPHATR